MPGVIAALLKVVELAAGSHYWYWRMDRGPNVRFLGVPWIRPDGSETKFSHSLSEKPEAGPVIEWTGFPKK